MVYNFFFFLTVNFRLFFFSWEMVKRIFLVRHPESGQILLFVFPFISERTRKQKYNYDK